MSKKTNNIKQPKRFNIMYIIYLALIILPLYFKGSYFEQAYLPFIIMMSIFTLIYIRNNYKSSRNTLIKNDTDLLLLLFIALYCLTFFYGVNKRSSLIEFAKYASYMSVFLLSRDMGKDNRQRLITIDFIILGGVVVSLIGIGTMIGTWQYTDSYVGTRLSSTFQYPNTLAVYVGAMYFLTMGQTLVEEDNRKIAIYGGILTIFFSTLIFTSSRGMWLLFPIILLAYFIILGSTNKVKLFFYSIANLSISLPFSFVFMRYIGSVEGKLWGLYLTGIFISLVIFYLLGLVNKAISKISLKIVFSIILILAIGMSGLTYLAITTTVPLTLENHTEIAKMTNIIRNSKNIFPNTDYILNVKGIAENNEDKAFAGRVIIYSVDGEGKNMHLGTLDVMESGKYDLDYKITTLEDTVGVRLNFINQLENTAITFEEAKIIDTVSSESSIIPLKYKYIPENIVSRVLSIGVTDNSAQARVIFSKDSLKLIKKNIIFGSGGDGWATSYRSVQSYPYWSKHVHNHFLQMMVEVGVLGFLLFVGFLFTIIYNYLGYRKKESPGEYITQADTLIIVVITILGHAAIDFDLSLVALSVTLWALLGLLYSTINNENNEIKIISKKLGKKIRIGDKLAVILIFIALLISSSIYGSLYFTKQAIAAQKKNDIDKIESNMTKSSILDPYNINYKHELINIYFYQYSIKTDESYGNKAKKTADRIIDIAKQDPIALNLASIAYIKMGLIEKALDITEDMVALQLLTIESYLQKVYNYLQVFDHYISKLELEKAQEIATRGSMIEEQLKYAYSKSIRPIPLNNELNFDLLKLKYYNEDFDDYIKHLEKVQRLVYFYNFDVDINNDGKLDMLHSSIPEGSKIQHESMTEGESTFIRITNEGEVYGFKYVYPLTLEPSTEYIVELKARGNTRPETFNLYAWANGATDPNQGSLLSIELTDDWKTYILEFTTDEDVKPGTQYIRIQHNGNDMGYVDIKDLTIFKR